MNDVNIFADGDVFVSPCCDDGADPLDPQGFAIPLYSQYDAVQYFGVQGPSQIDIFTLNGGLLGLGGRLIVAVNARSHVGVTPEENVFDWQASIAINGQEMVISAVAGNAGGQSGSIFFELTECDGYQEWTSVAFSNGNMLTSNGTLELDLDAPFTVEFFANLPGAAYPGMELTGYTVAYIPGEGSVDPDE